MEPSPYVFISYRRADTMAAARGLLRFLRSHYGRHSVFMDSAEIRDGSNWREAIQSALAASTIVLPIIGGNWLRLTDEFGKRRIDQKNDWVRSEIEFALRNDKVVIPIYVGVTQLPVKAFPRSIKQLADIQSRVIHDDDSDAEWTLLASTLKQNGFPSLRPNVSYPRAVVKLQPFTDDEIQVALKTLDGWRCVSSSVPGMEHVTRCELHKSYEFPTFRKAVAFMGEASIGINKRQHHPRWENIWRTVSVWLATWDCQFQVSELDVDLAIHLDQKAKEFGGRSI